MKRKIIFLIALLFILFSGCAHYPNPIKDNPLGKKYQNSVNLRNMELPLPEGEWTVIGRGYTPDHNYVQLILAKNIGNRHHSIVFITTNSGSNMYSGYFPCKELDRTNMLHVISNNNSSGGAQDGWYIDHVRIAFGKLITQANKESYEYIVDNKIVMPGNFIKTGHRFTGANIKSKYLTYSIFINPEVQGFDPPTNAEWPSSDWNILKINSDPKKVAFIKKLKEKGAVFHEKLKNAFGN